MLSRFVRTSSLFLFVIFLFARTLSSAFATGQTLKMMTFNAQPDDNNPGFNNCDKELQKHINIARAKAVDGARYMKDNQIEIALYQELYDRCPAPETHEYALLVEELKKIGYPMYSVTVPYNDQYGAFHHVATFSRYPFAPNETNFFRIANTDRWGIGIPVMTDFGKVYVLNVHIRGSENCDGVNSVFQRFDSYPNPKILGGDFNKDIGLNVCGQTTSQYQLNQSVRAGDLLLFPIGQPFTFTSTIVDRTEAAPYSVHDPVISIITTSLPVIPAHTKAGDADQDGDIDIFDYNIILQYFSQSTPAQHPAADYNNNGVVDIFDYNKVLENFGQ